MKLEQMVQIIGEVVQNLAGDLQAGKELVTLGLRRSARLPVLAALFEQALRSQAPVLLVTDRTDRALMLLDELGMWSPGSRRMYFPEPTPLFYENAPWGLTTRRDRLAVLTALAAYHIPGAGLPGCPPIIVAPARALMGRTLPRREFLKATRSFKPEQIAHPDEMLRNWVSLGYEIVNTVISPGQAARRGGILDIWSSAEAQPVRIELFGDEIETLRSFDPATQRTVKSVDRLQVAPAREFIARLDGSVNLWRPADQAELEEHNVNEFYIPVFHTQPASLLDYLPRSGVVAIDDLEMVRDTVYSVEEQAEGLRRDYITDGSLPEDFPTPYLSWMEIEDSLAGHPTVNLGGSTLSEEEGEELILENSPALAQYFEAGTRYGGQLKTLMEELAVFYRQGEAVTIVSRQTPRLKELWREQHPEVEADQPEPYFIEGSLSEGWSFHTSGYQRLRLLTDGEVFGWRRPEPRQRHRPIAEAPEAAYADLQIGDWVVHVDHGIGRFVDLVQRAVDGTEREFLCIEYADGDQLFVPVYQADRLTRYVGPDGRDPTPTRLGSAEWRNSKASAKEAIQEVAEDLLNLYATRQLVVGYTFARDTSWQQELEASFPYVETEDQLRVIQEVKRDMENPRPMDRLICGDVGYGKTEVALRAAFKAVMDGKQVAILVPTTVLAQQHHNTFRERLSAFPVEVEMLSRFRTPQQQREILLKLLDGQVDIIIGTHRLIQDDVMFKNLGLLIIDEEQRFGVNHKEKLKQMRTEVDVLTMTATPIPRTLYMALTGVRDISTINTPPEERLPVITHVGPYSPRLVRQAILREMERGGQVFFVHNRVHTIQGMRRHLEKLVPEARLAVAHGQMHEQDLSRRMEEFTDGNVDVLLSTSIIESGLDIPNANTLIVDRADTFGLAQLYQLRGRVGRGAQRAYAYFFRHSRRLPTLEGRERLETIGENVQLGAGYSIAMRDLEIRGMGDILGTRQHGHIAAVGFYLYTRLLAEAVRHLRIDRHGSLPEISEQPGIMKMGQEIRLPILVDLPLHVGIPKEYIPDRDTRLRLYRRIADAGTLAELEALRVEFNDRFGMLPGQADNLLYQIRIRLLADKAGLTAVSAENGQIVLRYPALPEGAPARSFPNLGPDVRSSKNALWFAYTAQEDWMPRLIEILEQI